MLSFLEVIDRTETGRLMSDQDYYLKLYVPELKILFRNIRSNIIPIHPFLRMTTWRIRSLRPR